MAVLAHARALRYEIGTNLKGAGGAAAWTLLLPRLDLRTVVVIGSVSSVERTSLSDLAERVVVIERGAEASELERHVGSAGDRSIDLVRIGRGGESLLERAPALRSLLADRLSDRASTFTDWRGRTVPPHASLHADLQPASDLTLAPGLGPARLIVPAGKGAAAAALPGARRAATPAARPGRWRVRVDRLIGRVLGSRLLLPWTVRGARLATRSRMDGPPAYVTEIAAAAGVNIEACGWTLLAPGDYATQKVLLVLLDPEHDRPRTIVKISPNPAHAGRLRTEAAALSHLATLPIAGGRVPVVEFAGEHAGRGIVGERWISGRPFEAVARTAADSPQYAAASGWLASLAEATVRRRDAGEVGDALRDLFERFRAALPVSADELGALEEDVRAVESHAGSMPIVFQHGDPGTWNLVVDAEDRVVFLDWEAAEPEGMPLWDLFHLQRSYGALEANRAGARGRGEASLRHLASASPLQERFAAETADHARAVGLAPELVAPLFFTCWMHRALKESTRRTPSTLDRGPYLRFLRAMLARRAEPEVRRLLGSGDGR